MSKDALILTPILDARSQSRLDALRTAHFPAHRNYLSAHVTMFHALPGRRLGSIEAVLAARAADTAPLPLTIGRAFRLGGGVAFRVQSPALETLRAGLANLWWPALTRQDRRDWHPHVTVQNKVEADEAAQTFARLAPAHVPWRGQALGLALHRYRGGPWEPLSRYPFGGMA
ncbi:2'-5' RNA ligase family protein [Roseobacter sp. HKCCA0434]|uniref:2'-5' RNA ligase family protein n=1 Tax=Roseobacter sp. HKCCA0434 TaxID=3079297 RepID=UPI002905DA38|nr:2'-5' RNA ligase family protein [Roseobacter sp. HKCCA0434]